MADGRNKPNGLTLRQRVSLVTQVGRNIIMAKGSRTSISGVDVGADSWMSVLQPLAPFIPQVEGWQWNRPVGWNIFYNRRARETERFDFKQLRALAQESELVRLVIETRKDQMCALNWQIKPKDDEAADLDDPRLKKLTIFFECPDLRNDWATWLRMLLEEMFVIDALTLYKGRNRAGKLMALEPVDGATIFPLLTEDARSPLPPDPAYQQILFGVPKADYTRDEMIYAPRNLRVYSPFGFGPVEQIAAYAASTDAQRAAYQLAYFTEGTVPDVYGVVDDDKMSAPQIEAFQKKLNDFMKGAPGNRRTVQFFPKGTKIESLKAAPLKDEFDEWLARKICFAFSIPPNAFIKSMNRATAESSHDQSIEEGLEPCKKTIANLLNRIIAVDFGFPDLEFAWLDDTEPDPVASANVSKTKVTSAIWTVNEAREVDGLEKVPGGDVAMVLTATGYIPITAFADGLIGAQAAANAQAALGGGDDDENPDDPNSPPGKPGGKKPAGGKKPKPGNKPGNTDGGNDADHSKHDGAYGRLGKAVRLEPLPFDFLDHPTTINLANRIEAVLTKTMQSVVDQVNGMPELTKDDQPDPKGRALTTAERIDLGSMIGVVDASTDDLTSIANDAGGKALAQIGVADRSELVGQVYQNSLDYATERAAEMVGMKWVNGELVDNPDAQWVITDSTRDDLRQIFTDLYAGDLKRSDLIRTIQESGTFSKARATLIARTEAAKANSAGALSGYQRSRDSGVPIKKVWVPDAFACPICLDNGDDGAIDLDDYFSGGEIAPPQHPNCRCNIAPVIDKSET